MFTVSELYIFPVKSLGGMAVDSAFINETGLEYDRRWMLIDENNKFLTQRELPVMALLAASVENSSLQIRHKHNKYPPLQVPLIPRERQVVRVEIWSDRCNALSVGKGPDDWFSEILGTQCRLVYMPEETKRRVDGRYAANKEITTFTDGYPTMIIGQASLDDLNSRIVNPLPMDRFRPNIVFTGGQPYEEDFFKDFSIGAVAFTGVKRCGRCMITTIDQQTLETGKEPLRTLAGYRFKNNKIYFGQNLLHKGKGMIKTGDEIKLLSGYA